MKRIFCLLIGYLFGCFLTADMVAKWRTGERADQLGSGNPGMANMMGQLGVRWGLLVLLGDVLKTVLACLLCRYWLFPSLGRAAILASGLGVILGHNFPVWKGFRGGKGVAVTCTLLILAAPLWGTLCCIAGGAVVALTGWLPLGAVVIPALFLIPAFDIYGVGTGAVSLIVALLMFLRHYDGIIRIFRGAEQRYGWRSKL